jgi:hypothetical protein
MHLKPINQSNIKFIECDGLFLYLWYQRYLVNLEALRTQ